MQRIFIIFNIFSISILVWSCTIDNGGLSISEINESIEDEIYKTVFKYQFEHNDSGQQQNTNIYFLSIMTYSDSAGRLIHSDPNDNILNYFIDNQPPVKRFSKCKRSISGVFDIDTNERGLLFYISEIKWISSNQIEVKGGYFESGISSAGYTYYVKYLNGEWVVIKKILIWIS